jgi:hypothetical protein
MGEVPVSNKSTLAILGFALAALLGTILKEMYWALAFETLVERAAHALNMPRADLIAAASPYVLACAVVAVVFMVAYRVGVRDRKAKSPLSILYDERDPRHAETRRGWYETSPSSDTRYYIDILNRTTDRTISNVRVTWDTTPFTRFIDSQVRMRVSFERRNLLDEIPSLHPQSRHRTYLFGFDDAVLSVPKHDDVLGHASHFTVRAAGDDAKEQVAVFEYSPLRFPKLRRVS